MAISRFGSSPKPGPSTIDIATARLARMRALAAGLLIAMAAVFIAAGLAGRRWPALSPTLGYVRAFAEAAMVGGCADWFAVTALFRRPLGLPIPHTGVISRSKDRIGEALGRFIADNFLTVRVLDERLRRVELAAWGADWLRRPRNAAALARRLAELAPDIVAALPSAALRDLVGSAAVGAVKAAPAAPLASALLSALWSEGRTQALIDRAAALLGAYLEEHQEVILEQVQAQSVKWLPTWVDKVIARKITAGLIQLLADVRTPDHPWRLRIGAALEDFIARLAHDPALRARGEALKLQLLTHPLLAAQAQSVWLEVEERLGGELRDHVDDVAQSLEQGLLQTAVWLGEDARLQQALNAWARAMVRRVIAPRRGQIGRFIAQVVSSWDAQSMVARLELQVGPDLQYIRVNGTLVGGLVGLIIYAASGVMGLG
jgi:uncharacterized membrane-anchored protein YjiN (DUF445 family)